VTPASLDQAAVVSAPRPGVAATETAPDSIPIPATTHTIHVFMVLLLRQRAESTRGDSVSRRAAKQKVPAIRAEWMDASSSTTTSGRWPSSVTVGHEVGARYAKG
jgi:hypothetical protein